MTQQRKCDFETSIAPKVIFSYGMTKSGSTFAFELVRTMLELAGLEQPKLSMSALGLNRRINFCQHLNLSNINYLTREIQAIGHPIVIKTHTRPDPCVIDLINCGFATVIATYRDPREIALSMLDQAHRNRVTGKKAFSEIETLDQAMDNIAFQIDSLTQWLYRPNCLPVFFTDLAFRAPLTAVRMARHLNLEIDPHGVVRHVKKHRFIQFNKGTKRRYQTEMSKANQRKYKTRFDAFHHHLIKNRTKLLHGSKPPLTEDIVLV